MMRSSFVIVLFVSVLLLYIPEFCNGHKPEIMRGRTGHGKSELKMMLYHKTCPQVEEVVRDSTWRKVENNPSLAAKLLRLHYHDCFVRGCDTSVLLDSTSGNTAEKDARPNLSLSGYDVINDIKAKLEQECPETVSCADILALAARDAVSFQFKRSLWNVFTGRKDGRVSIASEAARDLPSAGANFTTLRQQFAANGLDVTDLVALSGAHTIGDAHCAVFARRLFNFSGKGDMDPSLNSDYANFLIRKCSDKTASVEMDPGSSLVFDTNYFKTVNQNKGLFVSDAALLTDLRSAFIVKLFQSPRLFFSQFGASMQKMGSNQRR